MGTQRLGVYRSPPPLGPACPACGSAVPHAGSRRRILRPKADGGQAHFYAVVARETVDQEFAAKRQRFLAEQGYAYAIVDAEVATEGQPPDPPDAASPR